MNNFCDFNNADEQPSFELIPRGHIAKVRLSIKPGGYNNPSMGLNSSVAKQSETTGSIFLSCEYVLLDTEFAKRKIWSLIGIKSNKGDAWGNQGRAFIRAILESAYGIHPTDNSEKAQKARKINDLSELDGIVFLARIDIELDAKDNERNVIKTAITPDSKFYYDDKVDFQSPIENQNTSQSHNHLDDDIPF